MPRHGQADSERTVVIPMGTGNGGYGRRRWAGFGKWIASMNGEKFTDLRIRQAVQADCAWLSALAIRAVNGMDRKTYDDQQLEKAKTIARIDSRLVKDGSLYIAAKSHQNAGCIAWTVRPELMAGNDCGPKLSASVRARDGSAVIRSLFVDPLFSRQGIAKALIRHCTREARKRGVLRLEVLASAAAQHAFSALGFELLSEVALLFDDGTELTSFHMQKSL